MGHLRRKTETEMGVIKAQVRTKKKERKKKDGLKMVRGKNE